jgi:glycosyltransferase involved in cell wall biosynthesis
MRETDERPKISVYMITRDNERTLERALASVTWADEIVVVDSFSTDKTPEICRRFTDRVIQRPWPGFREQYQHAADLTTHPWIMFIDADEEVSQELGEEIQRMMKEGEKGFDGFIICRRTYYLGRWIRHGAWYPDTEIRLYRREKGKWEGGLHAKIVVDGNVGSLKYEILHYTYRDISDQIRTLDLYSRIEAEDRFRAGERFSLFKLLFRPPFRLVKEYLLKQGFRDGIPGFIIIVATMFYVFIKHAKLWELTHVKKEGKDGC